MEGIAAVPEWAPQDENHLLKSTSVIQSISYGKSEIHYQTYDDLSVETFRLAKKAESIWVIDKPIQQQKHLDDDCWTWDKLDHGGVLRIKHSSGNKIRIKI